MNGVFLAGDCTASVPTGLGFGNGCDALITDEICLHVCNFGYQDNNNGQGQVYNCEAGNLSGILLTCEGLLF